MRLKKLACFGLVLSLLSVNIGVTETFANEITEGNISEQNAKFKYIDTGSSRLSISNGVASVSSTVTGQSMVTKTGLTVRLQRYSGGRWENIQAWTTSSNSKACMLSRTYSVSKGYSYRLLTTLEAYMNSSSERQDITSNVVKY